MNKEEAVNLLKKYNNEEFFETYKRYFISF